MQAPDSELSKVARMHMSDEFTDSTLYQRLSETVPSSSPFSGVLKHLAETEHEHFEFWSKYLPGEQPRLNRVKLFWIMFLRRVFGLTFASRYLDRHEASVIKEYQSYGNLIPHADRAAFDVMVADEQEHEKEFAHKVESNAVRYFSFVVLGLADALVEISGIHAGSLGIYQTTEIAGLAGIVAGAAASIAMASAAFAQAKQGFSGSARLSAVYTGVSYFVSAVFLAAPYFLTNSMVIAVTASLALAIVMLGITTYYSTVIASKPFTRDFVEILAILLGASAVLYVFGFTVGTTLHVRIG